MTEAFLPDRSDGHVFLGRLEEPKEMTPSFHLPWIVLDWSLTLRSASAEAMQVFGLSPQDIGRSVAVLAPMVDTNSLRAEIAAVRKDGAPRRRDFESAGSSRVFDVCFSPWPESGAEATGVALLFVDVTRFAERPHLTQAAYNLLAGKEAFLLSLLDAAPFAVGIHTGPEHICIYANNEFRTWHPDCEPVGTTLGERIAGHDNTPSRNLLDEAYHAGHAVVRQMVPYLQRNAEGEEITRYFSGVAQPYNDEAGATAGVMAITYEVTDEKLSLERQKMLVSELRHRVKNMLTVVQAVAAFTAENATDKDDLLDRLQDRLGAIARSNSHLLTTNAVPRLLSDLIEQEMDQIGPSQTSRVVIKGPDLELPGSVASIVVLALHELIINAIKHGALSTPRGTVEITASEIAPEGEYTLTWSEASPHLRHQDQSDRREGFGTLLLTELVARELKAGVTLDFTQQGLFYEIRFANRDIVVRG